MGVTNNLTEFDSSVHHSGEVIEKVHGEEGILQGHMNKKNHSIQVPSWA